MSGNVVECPRHGGPWGQDQTCAYCTYVDGLVRPVDDPGPLGPGEGRTDPETLASHAALDRQMADMAEDGQRLVSMMAELRARQDEGGDEGADQAWREFREGNIYGTEKMALFRFTMAGFGPTIWLEVEANQTGWREYTVTAVRLMGNAGRGDRGQDIEETHGLWAIAERLVEEEG